VDHPRTPVERLQSFVPPFCPRRGCSEHLRRTPGYRFRRHGSYRNRRGFAVPRFRCLACRSTFSRQAFSTAYYLKRPELLRPVTAALVAGSAHRQIARLLGCAPSTVTRLAARAGRHALLFQFAALEDLEGLDEPVVLDHFEAYEFTQDLPFGIATAVGHRSWFVYGLDPAPHRRTGRRTPAQERRLRARPRRRMRGGYDGSTRRTLESLLRLGRGTVDLVSDDHRAYARAVRTLRGAGVIRHRIHPNPDRGPKGSPRSAKARARDRAMFPVDLLHGLIRHSQAAHRRETIAFGRRLNALMERAYVLAVWRNFVKSVSERRSGQPTPAVRIGLTDRRWTWTQVLARRLFADRVGIGGVERELYERRWITPVLAVNTPHLRKLAY
jgi:transposase-like protein